MSHSLSLALALTHLVAKLGQGDAAAGIALLLTQPRFNALHPLLYRAAQLKHLTLDEAQRKLCAHAYFQTVANTQRVQAELAQIATACAAAGIPLMVLKGSAFICDLYDEPGVRLAGDLDLLVPPDRLDDLVSLLQTQAYTLLGTSARHGLREMAHPSRPPGKGNVDIHSGLGPWRSWTGPGYPLDLAGVWRRARPLRNLPKCETPPLQMSPEDALLFIGFQAGQHGFNKFTAYFDLHMLATHGDLSLSRLTALVRNTPGRHPFTVYTYWALELTQALLGTTIPPAWRTLTSPPPLHRSVLKRWAAPARVLAGTFPEESLLGYILLARSPITMAILSLSAAAFLTRKALGIPQEP